MSHASQSPHRCEVCASLNDNVVNDDGNDANGNDNSRNGQDRDGTRGNSSGNGNTGRISDISIGFGKRLVGKRTHP